jgi:hypothetical protein
LERNNENKLNMQNSENDDLRVEDLLGTTKQHQHTSSTVYDLFPLFHPQQYQMHLSVPFLAPNTTIPNTPSFLQTSRIGLKKPT